jgi:hypothetical protein
MTNIIPSQPEDGVFGISSEFTFEPEDSINSRLPFSFDIIEHAAHGMVFLEACVPVDTAVAFLQMMIVLKAERQPSHAT